MKRSLYQTLKRDHSFLRYLQHQFVSRIKLHGAVIDLGAKASDERYHDFLDMEDVSQMTYCDIHPRTSDMKNVNLEQPLDIASAHYDNIILFNVLEHIYNYQNLVGEMCRILKPGGTAHVMVPFLWPYHGDPADFNRLTHVALYRLFREQGFDAVKVHPMGTGTWTLIGNFMAARIKWLPFRFLTLKFFLWLQSLENRIVGEKAHFSLAFYVEAEKC